MVCRKQNLAICILAFIFTIQATGRETGFTIRESKESYIPELSVSGKVIVSPPEEGLWSIATAWKNGWPDGWHHGSPAHYRRSGDWHILEGELLLPEGVFKIRDAYREENNLVKCIRRFQWNGKANIDSVTLSVRWKVPGKELKAILPGIIYYGNPSGVRNTPGNVPGYGGREGELAVFEEHRYPVPYACLESGDPDLFGAVLHTRPSPVRNPGLPDHWWSLGVSAFRDYSELVLFSGPVSYNGRKSVSKALQRGAMDYDNTFFKMTPGMVIEKSFLIDAFPLEKPGTAFQKPLHDAIDLYKPFFSEDLPAYEEILRSKFRLVKSRWVEGPGYAGFNMYDRPDAPEIVMGWCGQAASPGFSLQNLKERLGSDPLIDTLVQKSLDFLSSCPVGSESFPVRYHIVKKEWTNTDPVSMGQGMYNIAKAVEAARKNGRYCSTVWESFLIKACDVAASRILKEDWHPRSTAEAFFIAPLSIASELFHSSIYREAAVKGADHYAARHLDMKEPYWGGTLDARGEDKEGAWAALQGFLHVYDLTENPKYLECARHACDVCLSYTVIWDIPLPPGRMADHMFKTRGWTVVSPQNQHLDVYGVLYAPEVYRMGILTGNENLKRLARVMYLSCGQLIDPFGSQGEQMQHTNFAQGGDMSDIYRLRGGYVENWTVFWITAHFLNAAARFEEMKVEL